MHAEAFLKEGETIMDNYLTENMDTVIFDIENVLIHFAWRTIFMMLGYVKVRC